MIAVLIVIAANKNILADEMQNISIPYTDLTDAAPFGKQGGRPEHVRGGKILEKLVWGGIFFGKLGRGGIFLEKLGWGGFEISQTKVMHVMRGAQQK